MHVYIILHKNQGKILVIFIYAIIYILVDCFPYIYYYIYAITYYFIFERGESMKITCKCVVCTNTDKFTLRLQKDGFYIGRCPQCGYKYYKTDKSESLKGKGRTKA